MPNLVKVDDSKLIPDYLAETSGVGQGREDLNSEEMLIPRLKLAQALSDEMKRTNEKYIPELELGEFYNSVTGEVYGSVVNVVPLRAFTEYIEFDAKGKVVTYYKPGEVPPADDLQVVDGQKPKCTTFKNRLALLVHEDGTTEPIVVGFKMVGKKNTPTFLWNSLIGGRPENHPVYAYSYQLASAIRSNDQGEWYTGKFSKGGFVSDGVFAQAQRLYNELQGSNVKVDNSGIEQEPEGDTSFDAPKESF